MTYSERIAARRAHYAALVPPEPIELESPKRDFSILPFKLSPGKRDYYILVTEHGSTLATHMLHLHQCGETLANTRHLFAIYNIPEGAIHLEDIYSELVYSNSYERKPRAPICQGFSSPVVFHALSDIQSESKRIIKTNLE